MKRNKKLAFVRKVVSIFMLTSLLIASMVSIPVYGAIAATDHFTLTAAGDATTMNSGATLVFTVKSYDGSNVAKTFAGADKACIDFMNPSTQMPSTSVDITAVGAGISLTDVGSGASPWPLTSGIDISGTNNNVICFNIATGDADTNTITIQATASFNVYVGANGAAVNDGTGTYPGVDSANITVSAASSGADHLTSDFGAYTTAEVNQQRTVTINQVNSGGGLVTSALTDAVIDVNAVLANSATQTPLIESSGDHGLDVNDVVKFTSAVNSSAYYVVSTDASNTTFKIIGATDNIIYSNSNVRKVSGMSAGAAVALDEPGSAVTANTASVVNTQGVTTLVAGDIVSLAGCAGYYSVTASVNNGANSTVTVVGPTACTTGSGNITKITLTDGAPGAYTVSDGVGANGYIYSVGGVATGNQTTTVVTGKTLTSGTLSAVVVPTSTGTFTVTPYSSTANNFPTSDTLTAGSATSLTVQGYGPGSGQTGVPTNAFIDVMFNKDPNIGGVSFPLTNTTSSALSITSGGTAVSGTWTSFAEGYGSNSFYRVQFVPTSVTLTASTAYTISILKSYATGGTLLPAEMTALTDTGTAYTYTVTTGTSAGTFTPPTGVGTAPGGMGGNFTGTFGGSVPPMVFSGYPQPKSWNTPTNISKITLDFDRDMDATTFTNANIYLKKIVSGAETDPGVTTNVSPTTGTSKNAYLTITGTLSASSEYRVVVTRDVKDTKGTQLAGMPLDDSGNPQQGFGFGFANMGSFKESFNTGTGTSTVTATMLGSNLNAYKSGSSITNVPTTIRPRVSFGAALDPSTVNTTNVTLKRGSTPVTGTVNYDGKTNTIEFIPTTVLLASTAYTFAISTSVTSVTSTAISAQSFAFTTGVADVVSPQIAFVEADNYGFKVKFNEPMDSTLAENKAYYTLKTCSASAIASDGASCTSGSPTTVSLITGVNAHYSSFENQVWFDGLTLTAGDGFYVGITSSVEDAAGNAIDGSYDTFTGKVMDSGNFAGGQGMSTMGNLEMKDFNMSTMGMTPISANPMNSMAGATTKYFIRFPVSTAIPTGGWVEFTFPSGFTVTGVKQDAQSPMKTDFNGPATGTPTFATNLTSVTPTPTDGAGAQANDGVGYIAAAGKVYVKLSGASSATDFMQIDLDGVTNSSEPKDSSTAGYSVQIKTFDTSGVLLEATTSMPFFISPSGTGSIGGQITAGGVGVNGVTVYIGSPFTGPMETTTANNANSGGQDGEYKFSNLPSGQYMIFTQPTFTVGETDYNGKPNPEPITVSGATTKNFTISAANGTNGATQPVTITFTADQLTAITSLGFNDSIDIFAGSPKGFVMKTIARATLAAAAPDYTVNIFIPSAGDWMVGIGPSLPKGPMAGAPPQINWMPSQPTNVTIAAADIGGAAKSAVSFSLAAADKTITGKVIDASSTAISNAEIYCYNPKGGMGAHTTAGSDGTFTLNVQEGTYKVGAFLPGMPNSGEVAVLVSGSSFYVNGSATASTGSSGSNPFNLKINKSSSTLTIQGRVTDGTNAIANSAVWAHRTDAPSPPLRSNTDSTGNYTLYVSAGTWKVEADAPGYGYLGSQTITVTTESFTGKDFTVASGQGSIAGTIDTPGTSDDSGVIVTAYGSSGINETTTAADGTYTMDVPAGTYTVEAIVPGIGELTPLTSVVVDGDETNKDFTVGTPRTLTVTLEEAVSEDTEINFFDATGDGNELIIAAGSTSGSITIPDETYYIDVDVPGIPFSSLTPSGAEFNNVDGTPSTNNQVDLDGTGDNITLTLPTLYNVSGQVTSSSTGLNDATVSVYNTSTKETFAVTTSNNAAGGGLDGEYLVKLPAGTYSLSPDKPGYSGTPVDVVVAATSANNNFALTANSRTIAGTVTAGSSAASGAIVYAEASGGGFASTTTGTDGTYSLSVTPDIWTVNAETDGYSAGTALQVDVTSASETAKNFTLTALTGASVPNEPQTESVTPSTGGIVNDTATNTEIVIPPNALGSDTDAGQVTTKEVSDVFSTPTATPVGYGQEISATDADGNPITTLDDQVTFSLYLTEDELSAAGANTPAEADQLTIGYWDDVANNWVPQSSTKEYYDASGNIIPYATVAASATLTAAGVDHVYLIAETDHFTTYAPIVPTGATPPSTPATPTASAGNGQVTLTWTKNSDSDMSYYNIWEANVTEGVATTLLHSACGTVTCTKTIVNLTNGTAYSYQIIAIDTETNESAGSTAVSVTPVVPADGSLVSSGGSSSSSSKNKTSVTEVSVAPSSAVTVLAVSEDGVVAEEVTIAESTTSVAVTIPSNTSITDSTGEIFTGEILAPAVITSAEGVSSGASSASAPASTTLVGNIYEVGPDETSLSFSEPVTLRFPLSSDISDYSSLSVYYFDETGEEWLIAGDGGELMSDGVSGYVIEVSVDHLTKFAVFGETTSEGEMASSVTPFLDIASHWAKTFIEELYLDEIINGYDESHFGPDKNITRGELTKIAVNAFGFELADPAGIGYIFKDVKSTDWSAQYIQSAYDNALVLGYDNGTFRPNNPITRAEALKILIEASGTVESNYVAEFPDVNNSSWYAKYVNYAVEAGIVNGYGDGTFGPNKFISRAEVAKIVVMIKEAATVGKVWEGVKSIL